LCVAAGGGAGCRSGEPGSVPSAAPGSRGAPLPPLSAARPGIAERARG
jgi:hypothetical protein